MAATNINFGDPFFLDVCDFEVDGYMQNFDIDGHPGCFSACTEAIQVLVEETQEYTGSGTVFWCIPVAHISEGKIVWEHKDELSKMASAANALSAT